MKASVFRFMMNLYPPYLGAGVRVEAVSPDYRRVEVSMALRWFNRNYVGTHFGGSLSSMTDPFYMLMLLNILEKDYLVWDKSGTIEYVKPGRGTVRAIFTIGQQQLDDIYRHTASGEKYLPTFSVDVVDEAGEVVARVTRTLYIRKKKSARS